MDKNQLKQKKQHDSKSRKREFVLGDEVFFRNYHNGERWLPRVVKKKTGPVSYHVKLTDGHRRCHQDQIRFRSVDIQERVTLEPEVYVPPVVIANPTTTATPNPIVVEGVPSPATTADSTQNTNAGDPVSTSASDRSEQSNDSTKKSYPKRKRDPVIRFEPSWQL